MITNDYTTTPRDHAWSHRTLCAAARNGHVGQLLVALTDGALLTQATQHRMYLSRHGRNVPITQIGEAYGRWIGDTLPEGCAVRHCAETSTWEMYLHKQLVGTARSLFDACITLRNLVDEIRQEELRYYGEMEMEVAA